MLIHRLLLPFVLVATLFRAAPGHAAGNEDPPTGTTEHPAAATEHRADAADHPAPPAGPAAHVAEPADHAGTEHGAGPTEHAADPTEHAAAEHGAEPTEHAATEHGADATDHDASDRDADEVVTDPFDADGDGVVSPEEAADREASNAMFADIPDEPDASALAARPEDAELVPSMTTEQFRAAVRLVEKIVLGKMEKKIARASDKKMRTFSTIVFGVASLGLLLLFAPLVLRRKYPGQGKTLMKYSALAAGVFVATVLLFGIVVVGLRTAQGALSSGTNPSIAVARGVFGTLDRNADDYINTGKELFAPTLDAMRSHPDEPPVVLLFQNAQKLIKDARIFITIAKTVKRLDFVFALIPIILTFVTLLLFVLSIKPTLVEIVKLPAVAASGQAGAGSTVVRAALHRIRGELYSGLGTVLALAVITVLTGFTLSRAVAPALDALLGYLSVAVQYLQFVPDASSGTVGAALFGVILFLVLNLAALIVSSALFLGKLQKILQARFTHGVPLRQHARFFRWGIAAVVLVQLFPWLYVSVGEKALDLINTKLLSGVTDAEAVSWGTLLLAGPAVLVVGFVACAWIARVFKALTFLARFKVSNVELSIAQIAGKQLGNADIELAADEGRDTVQFRR